MTMTMTTMTTTTTRRRRRWWRKIPHASRLEAGPSVP